MELKFIDLFAGIGGIRKGFEQACSKYNISKKCVFTSEIKQTAIKVYAENYPDLKICGDIREISTNDIPDFDVLLGGFPCQAFSVGGKHPGFEDTRGTLFFEIARILKDKQPKAFLLENVPGLVVHDREHKSDKIGRTFSTILNTLEELGYTTKWIFRRINHNFRIN